MKKHIIFLVCSILIMLGSLVYSGTGIEDYSGTDTVKNIIKVKIPDDFNELFTSVAAISAGSGVVVSADDTSPGVLEDKLLPGEGIDFVTNNPASNETRTISGEDTSATNKGIVELATNDETVTGIDTARATTPAGVAAAIDASGVEGNIYGLVLSIDTDTDHDINITAGEGRDGANTQQIILASEITKQIDGNWSVGDDAPGLDTGSAGNNTLYAVWLIKRTDTGVEDVLFSASFSSPTMPTDYDKKRLVGYVLTDGSANIIDFTQQGDGREVTIWQRSRLSVASGLSSTAYATQSLAGVLPTSMVLKYLPGAVSTTALVTVFISHDGTNASTIFAAGNTAANIGQSNELYADTNAAPIFVPIDGANTHYKVGAQTITLYLRAAIIQR